MAFFRSVLFALVFYPTTAAFVLAAVVATLFGRRAVVAVSLLWVRFHRWWVAVSLGIRTRVEGALPKGPALVACKHQSMFETLELVRILGSPAPVLKRELADIPGFGWVARRYGVIPVDRKAGATALRRMMAAAGAATSEARHILIFPEGTRVAPGESPPLRPGFAGLYRALALPVVPVAVDSGRLWPRQSFVKRPGIVTIRFGKPIASGLSRTEIEDRVHRAINVLEQAPTL